MNRLALVTLSLLTLACAAATAKEPTPTTATPVGEPRVVWGVPIPMLPVCQFQTYSDGSIRYARTPATEKMTCEQFAAALQQIVQRFGDGATRIDECVPHDPCFAAKKDDAK